MKRNYPTWCLPTIGSVLPNPRSAIARLGAQATNAIRTKLDRSKSARKAARARNETLTPTQRSELARIAGQARWRGHIKGPKKRPKPMSKEALLECRRAAGAKGQAIAQTVTTPEQRREWGRQGGLASARKRWGWREAA